MNDIQKHPTSPAGVWFALAGKTHLAEYRYNPETLEFDLQFKGSPQCYRYIGVTIETVAGFQKSGQRDSTYSYGEYFVNKIKEPHHQCRKLTEEEAK